VAHSHGRDHLHSRVEREKHFYESHPPAYVRARRWIARAIGEFSRTGDVHAFTEPAGKAALDFGCGEGKVSMKLLAAGARRVTGFDVSETRLQRARRRAAELGFGDRAAFLVTDAHAASFRDGSFDLVVGGDVLHHLDLPKALSELRRILRPGGRAVFVEPLWHNPLLRLGRALTPFARTKDEHALTEDAWRTCASVFPRFRHYERELLTIPAMPLNLVLPTRAQRAIARRLHAADDRLLARWPGLGKHARITILVLE
jgi:ubiquinone/menaquinone biosynthesis C-methylase UbiE